MTDNLSTQRLSELVHQYYPANLMEFDEGYSESEQYQRLIRARQEALKNSGPWERMMSKLTEALPDCSVEDWSVLFSDDNCWRVRVYLPEVRQPKEGEREARAVVVLVSILAPVYVRYSSFRRKIGAQWEAPSLFYEDIPETKPYADKVEALVRSELDTRPLPYDTLFTLVPDVHCRHARLGTARLIDCLFTDDRW
ncbi:hypothetical protein [Vitiosangium sp. GDMCC 1.1324]|uniref:hypothetical protein n=1 Tax=Vitiosangium sp. (strain GDMCC 1.1324) TaxID=2138576 RepID=UPI000D3AD82E|nr:hypothetical protein [Vitiosangium sp. GDMCC 1.1324]PTL83770.1 hypothetical protein DAT35_09860 [Vitiosangium sp. GDMCC 1.1324]